MVGRNLNKTVEKIVDAHGGAEYWNSLDAFEAEISAWGFLFTMKRVPVLNRVRVRASTREPRFTFFDFPAAGQDGEFVGKEEVRITGSDGKTIARRVQPRSAFRGLRHWFVWDSLDFIYFGGYATWNYFTTPFLFLRDGFELEEMEPVQGTYGRWSRLRVTFPDDLPCHCRTQIFYFDENWLLRRLDYTAEVVGNWAHAAHFCEDYREFGGLKVPTRRWVKPLLGSKILPGPTLVAIVIHDMRPIVASSNPENL
jgi:hypothetical protein